MVKAENEHYITFMTPLVKTVRKGDKTETRRILKEQPDEYAYWTEGRFFLVHDKSNEMFHQEEIKCLYGAPGHVLLVKESYALAKEYDHLPASKCPLEAREKIWYLADGPKPDWAGRTRSSRFTPRWAIRTRLMVDDIQVERLLDITDVGAKAEGISFSSNAQIKPYRTVFLMMWDKMYRTKNDDYPSQDNPWVFVIKFHLLQDERQVA
jgi:hypothetical protein